MAAELSASIILATSDWIIDFHQWSRPFTRNPSRVRTMQSGSENGWVGDFPQTSSYVGVCIRAIFIVTPPIDAPRWTSITSENRGRDLTHVLPWRSKPCGSRNSSSFLDRLVCVTRETYPTDGSFPPQTSHTIGQNFAVLHGSGASQYAPLFTIVETAHDLSPVMGQAQAQHFRASEAMSAR